MGGKLQLHRACAYLCLNAYDLYGEWLYLGGHARTNEPARQPTSQPARKWGLAPLEKSLLAFLEGGPGSPSAKSVLLGFDIIG